MGASPVVRQPARTPNRVRAHSRPARVGFLLPLLLWFLLAPAGCTDDEIGTPLALELVGPGTGRVGEQLSVLYNVSGRRIDGIIFSWGDGVVDSLPTAGAQTASGSRQHRYLTPGRFLVRMTVEDGVEGVASADVVINIERAQ